MISIVNKPQDYSPVGNSNIWEFTSTDNNIVHFRVSIYISSQINVLPDTLLSVQDCYTTPSFPNKGHINISQLLKDTTKSIFRVGRSNDSTQWGMNTHVDSLTRYRLVITERIVSGDSVVDGATSNTSGNNIVFNSELDKISFKTFNYNYYLVKSNSNFAVKFLTSKPNTVVTSLNEYSRDTLSFLHEQFSLINLRVDYTLNDGTTATKTINQSYYGSYSVNRGITKVDVHPLALFTTEEISQLVSYNVYLYDLYYNVRVSERRYYKYVPVNCLQVPTNVVFQNKYGVYESVQFMAKESNLSVTRTNFQYSDIQRNSLGNLSEWDDYKFNIADSILSAEAETTWKLYTPELSDEESIWLSGILLSKKVYISVSDELWIPAVVDTSSYSLQRKRASRDNIFIKDISFKLLEGYVDDYTNLPAVVQDLTIEDVSGFFYVA